MTEATHAFIRRYFADLTGGGLGEELFTADATVWTLSTRTDGPAAQYRQVTKLLVSLFQNLAYTVHSITVEGDQAAAETTAHGVLHDGQVYDNAYVFVFRLRDGKIARLAEYFDRKPVDEVIMPALTAAMSARKA